MTNNTQAPDVVRVAYLGPEGTYSQLAVIQQFSDGVELYQCASIEDVFAVLKNQQTDEGQQRGVQYGVVPVENSTEGAINNTQDCLVDSSAIIVGEQVVLIEHNLLVQGATDLSKLNAVAAHKQSLAQCRIWLQTNYPHVKQIECSSNAEAAKLAVADGGIAAIAGKLAASIYQLEIARSGIQDQQHNSTRFLVLASSAAEGAMPAVTGNFNTSLPVNTENKPGALFRVLEPFENLQISLSKIETRPSKKEAWEYVFFIDFEGHINDEKVQELFARMQHCTAELKVLGSYPAFTSTTNSN